ncbi:glycosyltransferase family 4 protein [Salipiger mucosus]|uniref:Glycosyl transferase, group 1 n=1 Tax=Salipiger mucosus DSM 16094 TaxID=1123237 RepID=S9R1B3_9RHOB|nr:glycosyltransferase family 4 protein [Salipiger mucosus]EPX85738.1 glycosyl transferase, group 1 [Salipiger mucosus DSM 16094]
MKLLSFAHRLELGGTQINAIELAAELRDAHGFDVTLHAAPGPALPHLRGRGVPFRPAPDVRFHPSPARIRALRALVRRERPDVIHAWDWWQGLEAYFGVNLPMGIPLVISDMMMDLTRAMPREVPTTFGFGALRDKAEHAGWRRARLLLPPVDVTANAPGVSDGRAFRQAHGVGDDEILLVTVSRLAHVMKSECLERSIRALRALGAELPLRLVIVGDGEARSHLAALAAETNRHLGRAAVVMAGAMEDPRPAYAGADAVLGMGGSALRGLAHAAPVIVLGEQGFARLFRPHTARDFLHSGMFGQGDGDDRALHAAIRDICSSSALRADLGRFGRHFVVDHHGLGAVATSLADICREARDVRPGRAAQGLDAARTAFWYLRERRFRVASRDATVTPAPRPVGPDPLQP